MAPDPPPSVGEVKNNSQLAMGVSKVGGGWQESAAAAVAAAASWQWWRHRGGGSGGSFAAV